MVSARLFAMPAAIRCAHHLQLRRLEPDHHVGEFTVGSLAAVFDEPDVTVHPVAVLVVGHHLDVPDLGPALRQVVPVPIEPGADGQLERPSRLGQLAGIGMRQDLSELPGSWIVPTSGAKSASMNRAS
jgi:hypothetical protein